MLTDKQLMDIAATGPTTVGALRAVESAARADERKAQIEKDAAIVESSLDRGAVLRDIRAQLEGENRG